ncbi:stage II sporulation protein E [Halalkalibacillus halophilus]|uniref:stage II sporulation protein E n=1 Tax=Halalkalibacillus halophilus TaxID=392827 RepID=UPI00040D48E5|nr:stage II sporulation protein E [Halalkalibacillus halophilus]
MLRLLEWNQPRLQRFSNMKDKYSQFALETLFQKGGLLIIISFFLGRAVILTELSPFAIAFLAAVLLKQKSVAFYVLLSAFLGALTFSGSQGGYVFLSMFLLVVGFKQFYRKDRLTNKVLAILLFFSIALGKFTVESVTATIMPYDVALIVLEASLGVFLFHVFMQTYPFLQTSYPRHKVKMEEVICGIILATAVLTGLVGITVQGLSLELIGANYFILMCALIAGATVGSAVGVIVGLMLSLVSTIHLYQVSLLALAGLLGGLLKDMKRVGVVAGLMLATLLIGLYHVDALALEQLLLQSAVAALMFLITPKSWVKQIAKLVPGTEEAKEENEQYLQKVRDATADRVEKFSDMFAAISHSFSYLDQPSKPVDPNVEVDEYLSRVTEKTCQTCFKKQECWVNQFDRTYSSLQHTLQAMDDNQSSDVNFQIAKLRKFCVKTDQVVDQMRYELSYFRANKRLKQQVKESRRFVANQLNGVSEVMQSFAKEVVKERQEYFLQEQAIREMLKQQRLNLEHLELFSIDQGNVDVEITLYLQEDRGEAEKIIAPLLSDLLEETVVVDCKTDGERKDGYYTFNFSSIKRYQLETAVAIAAKKGNFLSGDSYMLLELGKSRFVLAISDGMGNGERAYQESSETLHLLHQILQSGINEQVALQSINSILSLRTADEIYSTLDLAMIDLQKPSVKFLKIGSMASFILRRGVVLSVEASNLPIGIVEEFDVEPVYEELQDEDILVMISDGILESTSWYENGEAWLKRKLRSFETDDPQEIADLLLEECVRLNNGEIEDDMTVLVSKIERSKAKWASFSPNYLEHV